jgi:phage terminase large subunit-like protein
LKTLLERLTPEAKLEYAKRRAAYVVSQRGQMDHALPASEWIQQYFYVPELKGPMWLGKYQIAALNEALAIEDDGTFRYSTIIWSDIKKSIKSCIAAGVGLWTSFRNEWGSVYAVANDLKGADSRVGYYMRRAIELNPSMKVSAKIRNYRIEFPNRAFIESIPTDPTGEAGSNADMVIFSELWGAHDEAQTRMWSEMTIPPNKFGKAFRWVETYAGYSGKSLLLEQLYNLGVREGEQIDLGIPGLEVYANRPARIFCLWNTRPRLPWQTREYYAAEEAILPPNEFLRLHRNQWVSSTETFIPEEWWKLCHYEKHGLAQMPPTGERQPVVFAVDAGVSNDHFGIVGVWKKENTVYPFYAQEWIPPRNGKLDFSIAEREIRRLAAAYNVVEWAYDEYQLHDMTTRLRREGIGYFRPFSQNAGNKTAPGRPIADKLLYDVIQQRRLVHDGNRTLTEHVLNADAQVEGKHERLMLVKRSPLHKIDCCVALSMATCEALRLNIG